MLGPRHLAEDRQRLRPTQAAAHASGGCAQLPVESTAGANDPARARRLRGGGPRRGLPLAKAAGFLDGLLLGPEASSVSSPLGVQASRCPFELLGCLRPGEVATQGRVRDAVVWGQRAQTLP